MLTVSKLLLAQDLFALGLQAGSLLMVHASMRKVGPVEGGADAVLQVLVDALGPAGTLVMALGALEEVPFDAATTPVEEDMGILAERFRLRPGTRVNDHAAARFGAAGPLSDFILEPAPLHDYLGPGSPLERFAQNGGRVLRLGADPDTITLTHYAEYLADLPRKNRVRIQYSRADSGSQWIESLDDTDGIADWEGGDYFPRIWLDFLAAGRARIGTVGNCTAEIFEASDFVPFAVEWMETHLR